MGTWRCPHCATLQAEGPRCFVCERSATSCGTCVNFRPALVGGLGYCAMDRRREPLSGDEQRPCWSAPPAEEGEGLFGAAPPAIPAAGLPAAATKGSGRLIELEPRPAGSSPAEPPSLSGA